MRIVSFVFMHLETTGLPSLEDNQTRITELAMVVLKRMHLNPTPSGRLPRITHKLAMSFKPGKEISNGAAEVSGLNNSLLENETMFNENVLNIIRTFLQCQQKPVCLIAHNGHGFGFPLLKNHFEMWNSVLPNDIMCVDSLYGFYDLLNRPQANVALRQDLYALPRRLNDVLRTRFYDNDDRPQQSFTLKGIYERVLQQPCPEEHTAENRSVMLAQIAIVLAPEFVQWVDNNYCRFSEVEALLSNLHFLL